MADLTLEQAVEQCIKAKNELAWQLILLRHEIPRVLADPPYSELDGLVAQYERMGAFDDDLPEPDELDTKSDPRD